MKELPSFLIPEAGESASLRPDFDKTLADATKAQWPLYMTSILHNARVKDDASDSFWRAILLPETRRVLVRCLRELDRRLSRVMMRLLPFSDLPNASDQQRPASGEAGLWIKGAMLRGSIVDD